MKYKVGDTIGATDMHATSLEVLRDYGGRGFYGPDLRNFEFLDVLEGLDLAFAGEIAGRIGREPANKRLYVVGVANDQIVVAYVYDNICGVAKLRPRP